MKQNNFPKKIAIIGLGYVGLPLALAFSDKAIVLGYDENKKRVQQLLNFDDKSGEISKKELEDKPNFKVTSNFKDLKQAEIFIITVPTPVGVNKKPNLSALKKASSEVGSILKKGDIIVFESTVFPGATEEICIPILEKNSNLKYEKDFFCGYSPERIVPGLKQKKISEIIKVVSASNDKVLDELEILYSLIIKAGIYRAPSIKVAEASKVLENTQRDANIALINEFSKICHKLKIDTNDVIDASATKWNFQTFRPGLVGGHCISVDPYYLTDKAQLEGYYPDLILKSRSVNDNMVDYIYRNFIDAINRKCIKIENSKILILGITFKENCSDLRNSKVIELTNLLSETRANIFIHDPIASICDVKNQLNGSILKKFPKKGYFDGIILAVPHKEYTIDLFEELLYICKKSKVVFDLKGVLPRRKNFFRL